MHLRDLQDTMLLRLRIGPRIGRMVAAMPRPIGTDHLLVDGQYPIRLLVTGGGLAAGYGTTSWSTALGAATAEALATASGRGVVADQLPLVTQDADEIELLMVALEGRLHDLVIWSPSFTHDQVLPSPDHWRAAAEAVRAQLQRGAADHGRVVLGVPRIVTGQDRAAEALARSIARANHSLADLARESRRTVFVQPPELRPLDPTQPHLGPAYYALCAERLVPVLLDLLGSSTASGPAADGRRANRQLTAAAEGPIGTPPGT